MTHRDIEVLKDQPLVKNVRFIVFVLISALIGALPASAALASASPCSDIFETSPEEVGPPSAEISDTENLIAYLKKLSEEQIIKSPEISRFRDALLEGKLVNPIFEEGTATKTASMIHAKNLQSLLEEGTLDLTKLLAWSEAALQENARVRVRREETRVKTAEEIFRPIAFLKVSDGTFIVRTGKEKASVVLTHSFEIMSSSITQNQWAQIMGTNPSHFVDGPDSITRSIQGKSIRMRPDHPVESATWWSMIVFANRLSEKQGLKPAYDISQVNFKSETSAEEGTLESEDIRANPIINAPDGNIYLAEGYRLPTEAEREWATRGGTDTRYSFGSNTQTADEFAWHEENSDKQTHEVATLKPNAYGLFDMHGNVWEWVQDWYDEKPSTGVDPKGPNEFTVIRPKRALRGGSWSSSARSLSSSRRNGIDPATQNADIGARLVRTVFPEKENGLLK